jgi:hypothetical protein
VAEEQALLAGAIQGFLAALEAPDVAFDYRIGVTTTDSGNPRCPSATFKPEGGSLVLSSCLDRVDQGEFTFNGLDFSAACDDFCVKRDEDLQVLPTSIPFEDEVKPRKWVERIGGQSNIAGVDANAEALQCYLQQGVAGCGFEAHLESMYLALAGATAKTSASNYGFLREDALLGVVIVSDEVDCSGTQIGSEIFKSNKVFWNSPDDAAPTSAMCWRAGVACTGGPGVYSECHAENYDVMGQAGADDAAAVLQPVKKYIDFLTSIAESKQNIDRSLRVNVALITGVPVGYDDFAAEIAYEDSPDPQLQDEFGIGPGCVLGDPGFPDALAVPPVREREVAEAFAGPDARPLYSICQADYSAALAGIAQTYVDQLLPLCFPMCVVDSDPETPIVEPTCEVFEQNIIEATSNPVAACELVDGAWVGPVGETLCFGLRTDRDGLQTPSPLDDMAEVCVDEGYNLEFTIVRAGPAPDGSTISAACVLSPDKAKDCPNL